ncbi:MULTISPECIES: alpha/beta hydrolase [Bacillaceae]|uniref:alpha/beta hydrolase n=1 Tax=Bacillaceae TaxID=186817 RepID=UPI0011A4D03C|nr:MULTISPECIES: alpha/beta hydrolase [Bacillaceae]MCM3122964.1 alpha/beta hydrolase [Mesobacillus sp. MER 33]MCM3233553.1 alpha/beta hydrolase [Mesobacillus sp. MER 48]
MTNNRKSIPFRLIEQKNETNNLVIVLPGAGYTTQAPLLYYTTALFFNKGFDVLHINYSLNRDEITVLNERNFARDVQLAIDTAINGKTYSQYCIVAKSIGTKALGYMLGDKRLNGAKLIWLTPLLQNDAVFNAMVNSDQKGLCIIGDNDHYCFIEERFEKLRKNQNLTLKLIGGGNHSLELENDPINSIEILKTVISNINEFSDNQIGRNRF